jgi:hypothetical protein
MSLISICLRVSWPEAAPGVGMAALIEIRVHASLLGGDAASRVIDKHHIKEIKAFVVEVAAKG